MSLTSPEVGGAGLSGVQSWHRASAASEVSALHTQQVPPVTGTGAPPSPPNMPSNKGSLRLMNVPACVSRARKLRFGKFACPRLVDGHAIVNARARSDCTGTL